MSLSIRIPIYSEPEKLDYCLESISNQTFQASEIILFFDKGQADYSLVLKKYSFLPIIYIENEQNLGAVPNMLNALYFPCNYEYLMVMHEDDYLQPQFIELSIYALNKCNEAVFSCTNISFFSEYKDIKPLQFNQPQTAILNKQQYILELLNGKTIGFGTIVYRSSMLQRIKFDFNTYSVLGDRPFLAENINTRKAIYINHNLYAAYNHIHTDNRWLNISEQNVYNLHLYYKNQLNRTEISNHRAQFTHSIINIYKLIPPKKKKNILAFYYKMQQQHLFSVKYYLLMNKTVRKIAAFFRKIKNISCT